MKFLLKIKKMLLKKVIIKNNVCLGVGVKILAGVRIKFGGVIAAGAVVTKYIEINSVYGGVPAKKIKIRS